ncbi:MAG TPA: fumarylacetoacetate hydrolase family protein [Terracidiphilus sp.]|nr:fumarylacetoacetate hydrolase family protein [Terracidiphilus sp.]
MKLFHTKQGIYVEQEGSYYSVPGVSWDELITHDDLHKYLAGVVRHGERKREVRAEDLVAPIGSQEVWAAGVTYFRSRNARMEESKDAGGGSFYDRVYSAERPELFFKAAASRVVGPGSPVRIRRDASWSVPEPELTLAVNQHGRIIGCTIGNDMSSRDIEGENPLYLPQAKVYDGSCALGPCVLISSETLPSSSAIRIEIVREGRAEFSGSTTLAEMKRTAQVLVDYLYRECSFPVGCYLMTGTGIIPPDSFTLQRGDKIRISIEGIGELVNRVETKA